MFILWLFFFALKFSKEGNTSAGIVAIAFFISLFSTHIIWWKIKMGNYFGYSEIPSCCTKEELLEVRRRWFNKIKKFLLFDVFLFIVIVINCFTSGLREISVVYFLSALYLIGIFFYLYGANEDKKYTGEPCSKCGLYNTDFIKDTITLAENVASELVYDEASKESYKINYRIGQQRVLYECKNCGHQYEETESYKERV